MKLDELRRLKEETNLILSSSEDDELNGNVYDEDFNKLRDMGFYRIYNTFYKDNYDCTQFYAIGFLNSETGYEYLISMNDEDEECEDLFKLKFDLYIVLYNDSKWTRRDKYLFTGTLQEILDYSKQLDAKGYKEGKIHKSVYSKK